MKTQYYTASSLDGFIADEHNSLDWLTRLAAAPAGSYDSFIAGVGAVAMGSTTYEWLLDHLTDPQTGARQPWPYTQPAWVFSSRTLTRVPGDIHFVRGDVRPVHEAMARAANGKNLWIVGGGDLAGQFHDHGLLDEIIVTFASVTLGGGAPLLPRRIATPPLRLMSATAYGSEFVELVYEVPKPGA